MNRLSLGFSVRYLGRVSTRCCCWIRFDVVVFLSVVVVGDFWFGVEIWLLVLSPMGVCRISVAIVTLGLVEWAFSLTSFAIVA